MLGGNYPLTINPSTGEMSAIPSILGVFQIGYAVKEFRNGQHIGTTYREFTFVVIPPASNQNYDVSGSVLVNGTMPLDAGKVQILERDISNDSLYLYVEQTIGAGAVYSFTDIPPGVFYIKATVNTASMYYNDYLPTYYNSAAFWYNATPINQCDTSQLYRDIHLIHVDSFAGFLDLDGEVYLVGGNNDPVAGLNLLLGNESGELIQARTTNNDGYFKFENLAAGNYYLFADLINSSIDNSDPPLIELTANASAQVYLYPDSLSVELSPTIIADPSSENKFITIFPNPTSNKISMELNVETAGNYSAKIYDIYGHCLNTVFENKFLAEGVYYNTVDLEGFSTGVYFIEMQSREGKVVKKFIKQ